MGTMSVSLKPTEAELEEIISSDWYISHEEYTDINGNEKVHVYGEHLPFMKWLREHNFIPCAENEYTFRK